jgi:uncharacterized protein (TIGR04141 family)
MSKSRKFSIYLLKEGFDASNSLKEAHLSSTAGNLPDNATLFVFDNQPNPPWWRSYFGITEELWQVLKGAILFVPSGKRCFALTFGHVYHHLKDTAYEYDFGLLVTLNCIDPDELKSADTVEPGAAKRRRTQIPIASNITYLDFDKDTTVVKSLTGKVKKEFKPLFKDTTGAVSLRVSMKIEPHELPEICGKLLERYNSEDYKIHFPDIDNIKPVKDPAIVSQLDAKLFEAFKNKNDDLQFCVPDILDYGSSIWFAFSEAKKAEQYEDVYIGHYYEFLETKGVALDQVGLDSLKGDKLYIREGDKGATQDSHSIYRCCVFDTKLDGADSDTYHLCDGAWYKINADFIAEMDGYLDEDKFKVNVSFPEFNHKNAKGNYSEGAYNEAVAAADESLVCLDKKDISPKGETQIEPCDIYTVKNNRCEFYHVKRSTLSVHLSHLFNQGNNSARLLISEPKSRQKFKALIGNQYGDEYTQSLSKRETYDVIFVIITGKDVTKRSENLPLFSRISLRRNLRDLEMLGVKAGYCFVKDASKPEDEPEEIEENAELADAD